MEGRRKLDALGRAATALLTLAICAAASAADDLQRGTDLARSGSWQQALAALLDGERQSPRDKRFPLELAGVEYRQNHFTAAKRHLRRALRLDPADRYANDFLGTLYYLEGNLEAALRYWNRIEKPRLNDVTVAPQPRVDPVLLDSALALAPATVLRLDELRTAEARLDALDILPSYRIELAAHPEESFDATIRWLELPAWMRAASAFRGIAYQTVRPEWRDIAGSGTNWSSLLRWDAQKRRGTTSVTGPLAHRAKWRYRWYADARGETWNSGAAGDFRLQRLASGFEFQSIPSWRLSWHTGVEVSTRHFYGLPQFPGGSAVMYRAAASYELWRVPERRFTLGSALGGDFGRMFSNTGNLFTRGQGSIHARWLPQARGDDYELNAQLRAGTAQGPVPFDELFMLGVERDSDLWLRGHAGTLDGKKGGSPIGRNYLLANWDIQKQIYRHTLFTVSAGPFLDTGRTNDVFGRSAFRPWLVDAGVQASVKILGAIRVNLIYGRDLRGGGHVIYSTVGP